MEHGLFYLKKNAEVTSEKKTTTPLRTEKPNCVEKGDPIIFLHCSLLQQIISTCIAVSCLLDSHFPACSIVFSSLGSHVLGE